MRDGALADFLMRKGTGSTSGVSVGRLIYRCAGLVPCNNTYDFLVRLLKPPPELNGDVRSILSTATQAIACAGKPIATFTITHADRNSISMSYIEPV